MAEKVYLNIHILVAEDDNFQRLALIDILTLCDYQVTAVENGRLARDELLKEDSHIDLVLLDLKMPEMDGFELLCLMQLHDHLRRIPVIMMSFDNESEIVATCLEKGAQDYLVKPLRIQNVKGIAKYVKQDPNQFSQNSSLVGLQQYQVIRTLGQGAGGSVELVRKLSDGNFLALKTISMRFMNEQEKKNALSEVTLLKVLDVSTIIRYFEHFVDNDSLYIVMEYAKDGALSDKIQEHKQKGIRIDEESILYFTAQITIALHFMHQKNILHRDIKSQNLFLTKENVVKLGDFGISKALGTNADLTKTLVGTPYFMSPEVCGGQTYGQKADIWALGCTLYEMVMLRRPFDDDNINNLFNQIRTQEPPPLHDNTSSDLRMLITLMLNKDPIKRPSAQDLINIPIINKNIRKYQQQDAKDDAFLEILLKRPVPIVAPPVSTNPPSSNNQQQQQPSNKQEATCNTVEQTIKALSESLVPYDQKVSMFNVERNVINGEQIFGWFNQYYPSYQTQQLVEILHDLVEKKHIHHISGPPNEANPLSLYKFQFDMKGIPANSYKIYTKQARQPLVIMQDIIEQANTLLNEVTEQYTGKISEEKLILNKKYNKFLEMVCELQKIYLVDIQSEEQRKCFFINLIQVMYFHKYLKERYDHLRNEKKQKVNSVLDIFLSYFPFLQKEERFYYKIGYHEFTIDDVKHGILRGNKSHKLSNFKPFDSKDEKRKFTLPQDLRVLVFFKEENVQPTELKFIKGDKMDEQLNEVCTKFLSTFVSYDVAENDLIMHKLFQIYEKDFGKEPTDSIVWASKYTRSISKSPDLIENIKSGEVFLQYQEKFEI